MAVSYARGVLVSKSLTLPKGVHDGFLPVNKKKFFLGIFGADEKIKIIVVIYVRPTQTQDILESGFGWQKSVQPGAFRCRYVMIHSLPMAAREVEPENDASRVLRTPSSTPRTGLRID